MAEVIGVYEVNSLMTLWIILTAIFILLAIFHYTLMKKEIQHFRAPTVEELRFGEENAQRIGHVHIFNRPLQIFQDQVNDFVDALNRDNRLSHKASACGYIAAAITSAVSLYFTL